MSHIVLIFLVVFLNLSQVYGHSGEIHGSSKPIDNDGFEIVPMVPSKKELAEINVSYLRTVKKIFSNKCLSCHGVNDSPPWYYHIPGPKQLMDDDMREAKKHMDMSNDFPFDGHGSPIEDLNALKKTLIKGDMPPIQYRIMHWDSKPTESEVRTINDWIENSQNILNQ